MSKKVVLCVVAAALAIGALAITLDITAQERGMGGRGRGRFMRGGASASFESSPMPRDEVEKKILSVLEDMFDNQRFGMMNVPPEDGRLLRLLAETTDAKHVVEIGTSHGFSGLWFCMALQKTGGKLITHEINPYRVSRARENFKRAGVDRIATVVQGDAHEKVKNLKDPIDIIFLDADKEGYIDYLQKLLPLVRPGGLIIADNTSSHSDSMEDYLKAVTSDPNLETFFLEESRSGTGITLKKR